MRKKKKKKKKKKKNAQQNATTYTGEQVVKKLHSLRTLSRLAFFLRLFQGLFGRSKSSTHICRRNHVRNKKTTKTEKQQKKRKEKKKKKCED
jgi:hypothetical protein